MLRSSFIPPCYPTLRDRLPKGEGWLFEVKFDGYRLQVHKAGARVILYTRNGADWTYRFPRLAEELTSLPCSSAIIDAELVHVDGFEALHRTVHKRAENGLMLWAFDLMQCDGNDLRAVALADRKRRLGHLVERAGIERLRHSETFPDGERLLAECDKRGLEGVVAKHKNGIYRSGLSTGGSRSSAPHGARPTAIGASCSGKAAHNLHDHFILRLREFGCLCEDRCRASTAGKLIACHEPAAPITAVP